MCCLCVLQEYIASNYTKDETASASRGLSEVQTMRAKLVTAVGRGATDADHAHSLQAFQSYYRLLVCLMARFPFQSASRSVVSPPPSGFLSKVFSAKKVTQVSLLTTWFDALRHSNRVSDYDIMFERVSVGFNVAALYSRQATQIKSSVAPTGPVGGDATTALTTSSLKEACRLFQLASGIFEFLSKLPEIMSGQLGAGVSIDMTTESLSMLHVLMLAQAQACFFEAATTTASPKLVAKLAMGVAVLFQDAHMRCEKNLRLKGIEKKPDVYPWAQHCAYQMLCYQAASNYWFARGALAEDEYGVEIAHLERAKSILMQAKAREIGLLRNLAENRTKLEGALNARLAAAMKDNDTIYYSTVPKPETVKDPESVQAVKPVPFSDAPGTTGPAASSGLVPDMQVDDPFRFLVSPFLRAQHDAIRGRVGEVQAELAKKISASEQASKTALETLGLPASLDAMASASSGGLPEDVWNRVQEIQFKGGITQLQDLNSRIASAVVECQHAFESAATALAKEAEMDGKLRTQFSHRWNRRPSEQLTVHLQKDAESIRRFLRDADTSNTKVRAELENCRARFQLLTLTRPALEEKLPRATAEQSQGSQENIAALRTLIAALHANTAKMQQLVTDFQAKSTATDFMQILQLSNHAAGTNSAGPAVAQDAAASESLYTMALEPFQTFSQAYDDCVVSQTQLLEHITAANTQFLSRRSADDSTARRQSFLQDLNVSIASFNKLLANLNEGLKFYSDLQSTKIGPFQQKVTDFAMAREMEAKLVLDQLTRAIAGYTDEDSKQPSVFPAGAGASAPSAPASSVDSSGVYGGGGASSAPAASNPNLAYEPKSQLYNMNSPPPTANAAAGAPAVAAAGAAPARPPRPQAPVQPQPPQQQQPQQHYAVAGMPSQQQPNPFQNSQQMHPPQHHAPQQWQAPQQPHYAPAFAQQPPQQQPPAGVQWACRACTFVNSGASAACEMCATRRS